MKQHLFISYCWSDGLYYADELQHELQDEFTILRDKEQENSDDIYDYMSQMEECENVVIVLTEAYLHSLNCMLEVSFLVDGENWAERMTPLVLKPDIYTTQAKLDIIAYWNGRQQEVTDKLNNATSGLRLLQEEKQQVDAVVNTIEEFLDKIGHLKNPSQIAIVGEIRRKAREHEILPDLSLHMTDLNEIRDEFTRKSRDLKEKERKTLEERRAKIASFLERHAAR